MFYSKFLKNVKLDPIRAMGNLDFGMMSIMQLISKSETKNSTLFVISYMKIIL